MGPWGVVGCREINLGGRTNWRGQQKTGGQWTKGIKMLGHLIFHLGRLELSPKDTSLSSRPRTFLSFPNIALYINSHF